jgi:2-haloacid dehalogenase
MDIDAVVFDLGGVLIDWDPRHVYRRLFADHAEMEPDTFAIRRERFTFMRQFDGHVISGIEGVAKPDRRIFEILLGRYDLRPGRAVFVDDSQQNVDVACALGINALHYTSAPRLRHELRLLGLP